MLEVLLSHPEMFFLFLLTISVQLLKQSLKTIDLFDVSGMPFEKNKCTTKAMMIRTK